MTKIEWTEATWNPLAGCSIVSPGCTNCYAMKMAHRLAAMDRAKRAAACTRPLQTFPLGHYAELTKVVNNKPVWTGKVARAPDHTLFEPLRRKRPTMYFVNSMSDLFHEDVPDEWIDRVFAVMALCPQHTYQVLTKRSARMRTYFAGQWARREALGELMFQLGGEKRQGWYAPEYDGKRAWMGIGVPLPNVWLGVSAERQKEADERIPDLLATPAVVRFVSAEPLLGPIDFTRIASVRFHDKKPYDVNALRYPEARLDWIIVGGESGPDARLMDPNWARSIRDQCQSADVPFFFKQWGRQHKLDNGMVLKGSKKIIGRLLDGREWNEMPGASKYDQSPTDPHHGGKVSA